MALNKYMHPRNCYKNKKPDFKSMALKYDEFRKHVTQDLKGKVYFDFKSADALRTLCVCLLKEDFDLDVELPTERLVPTVPLRLNYIHWIEDIIDMKTDALGIDIGTGACCIYPLLGCRINNWKFLATEVDEINLHYAEKNISTNQLQDRITVQKVSEEGSILLDVVNNQTDKIFDFSMCNPPFFIDNLEAQGVTSTRKDDRSDPSSVNTASPSESVSDGGEVAFIKKMISESIQLKNKIRVFTSMVGKKSSVPHLKQELREKQITNFGTTEFCQGKTMRWGIAWTFDPTVKFTKSEFKTLKKEKPPLVYIIPESAMLPDSNYIVPAIWKKIKGIFSELKIAISAEKTGKTYATAIATANDNTWSHQRKKRREKQRLKHNDCNDNNNTDNNQSYDQNLKNSDETEASNSTLTGTSKNSTSSSNGEVKATPSSTENQNNSNSIHTGSSCTMSRKRKSDEHAAITKIAKYDSAKNCDDENQTKTPVKSETCDSLGKSYILKCTLDVKWENRQIVLKMKSMDRDNRETLHQVFQYLKNQFQGNNNS